MELPVLYVGILFRFSHVFVGRVGSNIVSKPHSEQADRVYNQRERVGT